jgi:hypothetical protein
MPEGCTIHDDAMSKRRGHGCDRPDHERPRRAIWSSRRCAAPLGQSWWFLGRWLRQYRLSTTSSYLKHGTTIGSCVTWLMTTLAEPLVMLSTTRLRLLLAGGVSLLNALVARAIASNVPSLVAEEAAVVAGLTCAFAAFGLTFALTFAFALAFAFAFARAKSVDVHRRGTFPRCRWFHLKHHRALHPSDELLFVGRVSIQVGRSKVSAPSFDVVRSSGDDRGNFFSVAKR